MKENFLSKGELTAHMVVSASLALVCLALGATLAIQHVKLAGAAALVTKAQAQVAASAIRIEERDFTEDEYRKLGTTVAFQAPAGDKAGVQVSPTGSGLRIEIQNMAYYPWFQAAVVDAKNKAGQGARVVEYCTSVCGNASAFAVVRVRQAAAAGGV